MFKKKTLFVLSIFLIGVIFLLHVDSANASATGCSCFNSNKASAGAAPNDISASDATQCNLICNGVTGGAGGWYDYKNSSYIAIDISAIPATAGNCSCTERVALNMYDIKSKIPASNNGDCMDKCRANGNEFYSYPDQAATTGITVVVIDRFRYAFNCACLTGSVIPTYYPVGSLNQVVDAQSCNAKCYTKSANYYAFESIGALSGWKTAVTAPVPAPTTTMTVAGSSGQIADTKVPGTTIDNSGIIKCGRPGQEMCTLCDLIAGMNNIIQYLMKIAVGVALLAMTIGGVMYVISAGDGNMTGMAKKAITNAAIGFVIIFAAYLIINTLINYIGTKPGMGINITSWGNFTCSKGLH